LKIALYKITKTPLDFIIKSNKIIFKGYLEYHSGKLVLLKADLDGSLEVTCDRCASEFEIKLDENVAFFISDGIYKDEEGIELDVVESFNSIVDLEEILSSEIELIKSDYHSCENCRDS